MKDQYFYIRYSSLVLFALVSIFLVCSYFFLLGPEINAALHFKPVNCEILDKKLEKSHSGKKINWRPNFQVAYEVADQHYSFWTYDLAQGYTGQASQQKILDQFKIGQTYTCWYDPKQPGTAVLKRELAFDNGFRFDFYPTFLLFCSILGLMEFFILFVILFPKLASKLPMFKEKDDDKNFQAPKNILEPHVITSFVPVEVVQNVKNKVSTFKVLFRAIFGVTATGIVLSLGCIMIWGDLSMYTQYHETQCEILDKKVYLQNPSERSDGQKYFPQFLLSYLVKNKTFTTWGYSIEEGKSEHSAKQILDKFQSGNTYPCWYNPKKPNTVILTRVLNWQHCVVFLFMLFLFLLFSINLISLLRKKPANI